MGVASTCRLRPLESESTKQAAVSLQLHVNATFVGYCLFMLHKCFVLCLPLVVNEQISQFGGPSLVWIWVFAFGFLGISSLGIYAACSENTIALKIVRTKTLRGTLTDLYNMTFYHF